MKVLLDTNFCLSLEKNAWPLEELVGEEVLIPDFIRKEIIKVSAKHDLILEILKKHGVKTVKTNCKGDNDEALISTAQKLGAVILTNDSALRKRAKAKGVQTFYLRQRRKIQKG